MKIYTLGEKIKARRKERKMTLKDLAGDRITPGQISLVESGKSNPSSDLLEYLAQRLNTKLEYLLESEETQAKRHCEYYMNVAEIALYLEMTDASEKAATDGLEIARKYKLNDYTGVLELMNAKIRYSENRLEEAQQYCIAANSLFLKENNIEYSVKSFMLLGQLSLEMGYLNAALNYFLQGETILTENNLISDLLRAELYHNIAKCYSKANNHHRALEYADITIQRLQVLKDKKKYADRLLKLCIENEQENRLEEALNYSREARKFHAQMNEMHNLAEIETNLGEIFSKAQNFQNACQYFESAVRLKTLSEDKTLPLTLLKMSEAYNDHNESEAALEIVEQIGEQLDSNQSLYKIKSYEQLYNIHSKLGNIEKAKAALLEGVGYIEKLDQNKYLGDFYSLLGRLSMDTGDSEQAIAFINKGIDIYKKLGILLKE